MWHDTFLWKEGSDVSEPLMWGAWSTSYPIYCMQIHTHATHQFACLAIKMGFLLLMSCWSAETARCREELVCVICEQVDKQISKCWFRNAERAVIYPHLAKRRGFFFWRTSLDVFLFLVLRLWVSLSHWHTASGSACVPVIDWAGPDLNEATGPDLSPLRASRRRAGSIQRLPLGHYIITHTAQRLVGQTTSATTNHSIYSNLAPSELLSALPHSFISPLFQSASLKLLSLSIQ